jgi:uncharacterized Ntn-hydrolase superfamily protein
MTFTIIGRCDRTGRLGFAQATGTPAIGQRAVRVIPGKAVVTVQAGHNGYLLSIAMELTRAGFGGKRIFDALQAADPYSAQRQLMFLPLKGPGMAFTGTQARPWAGHLESDDFVAAGNVLAGAGVVGAMADAFRGTADQALEDRLLRALEAGRDAGGQADGERSAALYVAGDAPYPLIDLRVDVAQEPTGELRKAYDWYRPLSPFYAECYEKGIPAKYKDHLRSIGWAVSPYEDAKRT